MNTKDGDLFPDFFSKPTMNEGAEEGKLYKRNVGASIPEN